MKPNKLLLFIAILSVFAFIIGCNSAESKLQVSDQDKSKTAPPATTPSDGARRITITELKELQKKNAVYIVDVRNQASYDAGHIPGSVLIPAADILKHVDDLPRNRMIVTYCS
jgi:3-mercaptopyruvate sulfurtransferase SseA